MGVITDKKFPCPYNQFGTYTTIEKCETCKKSDSCDIYATMLDELEEDWL